MIGPYLILQSDPPLTFLSVGDTIAGLSYPVLTGVGSIRQSVDGAETANVAIDLDNADGFISVLLAVPPLGASATLYGPDGVEWFRGMLAQVSLGETSTLTLEG